MPLKQSTILNISVFVVVVVATAVIFSSVATFDFIDFDDDLYVTKNLEIQRGWDLQTPVRAITKRLAGNWQPLTFLAHATDYQIFGGDPAGHHLSSAFLHAVNAGLFFLVARAFGMGVWPAAFVALAWGLHPLRVESVAWIAERKDLLCAFFFFLALLAYRSYVRLPGPWRYALAALWMMLSLMAKPMIVTLPFLLLVLDIWPLGRLGSPPYYPALRRLFAEKIPLIYITVAFALIAILTQSEAGAVRTLGDVSLMARIQTAIIAYASYLRDLIIPGALSPYYMHPRVWSPWVVAGCVALLALASFLVFRIRKSRPWWWVGWLWFLGMLVPVIGLVQVGDQWRADRYTYLPVVGLVLAVGWEAEYLTSRFKRLAAPLLGLGAVVLTLLAYATHSILPYWTNTLTVSDRAISLGGGHWSMRTNRAIALSRNGKSAEALKEFEALYRDYPLDPETLNNLAFALLQGQRADQAEVYLEKALRLSPNYDNARINLGRTFLALGRYQQALECYEHVIATSPDLPGPFLEAAKIRATIPGLRNPEIAKSLAQAAIEKMPGENMGALEILGMAHWQLGEFGLAAKAFQNAATAAAHAGRGDIANTLNQRARQAEQHAQRPSH